MTLMFHCVVGTYRTLIHIYDLIRNFVTTEGRSFDSPSQDVPTHLKHIADGVDFIVRLLYS